MTRTLYRRDSVFMRAVSMVVAFTFVLSIAGTGLAVPAVPEVTTASASSDATVVPQAEPPAQPEAEEPAPGPSVEAPPTTTEPPVLSGGGFAAAGPRPDVSGNAPAKREAATTGTTLGAAAGEPFASFQSVSWEAYRVSPKQEWAKSNLGQYYEGDWIPVRIIVDNKNGAGAVRLPSWTIDFDRYDSGVDAIAVDDARDFMWYVGTTQPTGRDVPGTASSLAGVSESGSGTAARHVVSFSPAGDLVIPKGSYGIVYLKVHLALTPYWQMQADPMFGARQYPGSSAQGHFLSWNGNGTGQNTISVPVGRSTTPVGVVNGIKFNDLDHNGIKAASEPGLAGWEFTLQYGGDYPFSMTTTSAADGTFAFSELPTGQYTVTETEQAPWVCSTGTTKNVTITLAAPSASVSFGNYLPDLTKTWALDIDALPSGAVPFVSYRLNGESMTTTLTGPPYQASVSAPYNASITDIQWFVRWNATNILVDTGADEVLDADKTNTGSYDSSVSGMKYHDLDGNGSKDAGEPGLGGWTILLKRVVEGTETLYAQTVTAADGTYSFEDVLPGTYKVYEENQTGWYNTAAPTASFAVADGSDVTGKDFGNLAVLSGIDLEKTGPDKARIGDTVDYTITVTNTGNYTLYNVMVGDQMLGVDETIPTLAPGDTATINASHVVTASDDDPLPNLAVATAVDILGTPYGDQDTHEVGIIHPAIDVAKTAAPSMATNPARVTYEYTVTNSGDDTLTAVVLSDDKLELTSGSIGSLDPGQVVTMSAEATLTATTTNIASVVGEDSLGGPVSDQDDATVEVYNPSVSIVKSADPVVIIPGELVSYAYLVTNTGDIALDNVTVTDDKIGWIGEYTGLLLPGSSWTVHGLASPSDDVVNIGTVTADYGVAESDFFGTVSATSSATVDVVHPSVSIDKSVDRSMVTSGTTVTYSYAVSNTGDVALYDLVVNDDVLGPIGTIEVLAVGASATLTSTAVLTETTDNVGTVTGRDTYGHPVTASDTETVSVFHPAIAIDKSVSDDEVLAGTTVTYTYDVDNTGDITLHDIEVVDDKLGTIGTIGELAAGASSTLSTEAVIAADVTNVGTATGHYGEVESDFSGSVSASDTAFVDVVAPAVEIIKSASPRHALPGTDVTYDYLVRNTGDVTLYDLVVYDDKLGEITTIDELAAGAERSARMVTQLSESTVNVVEVTGYDANENRVWDDDSATVCIWNPAVSIVKSADPIVIIPGELVSYTYLVTNTGDMPLSNVTVTDDKIGWIGEYAGLLLPGSSWTVHGLASPADDVVNIGTVTGDYAVAETDFFGTVSATSSAAVDVVHPAIAIDKSVSDDEVLAGTTVTYTYDVDNTGDIDLYDIEVVDDKLGTIGTIGELAAGASLTLSTEAVIAADVTNVGTATGHYGEVESDFSGSVSASDTAFVDVVAPAVEIIKSASPRHALPGTDVTYDYLVRNTGDVTLYDLVVYDDKLGEITTIDELAAGAERSARRITPLFESTINVVEVTGYDANENRVWDDDSATVCIWNPAISIAKSASATNILAGELVTYTYLVTNTGDMPLTDVSVDDDVLGHIATIPFLAAGASIAVTAPANVMADVTNMGTATGAYGIAETDFQGTVSASASAFVNVVAPSIDVEKAAAPNPALVGTDIFFGYRVTNTGDVPLVNVELVDDVLGAIGTVAYLAPGASQEFSARQVLDVTTTNIVTATATDEYQHPVTDSATVTVDIYDPSVRVVKTATPEVVLAGETVTYEYVVTNTGDIALSDLELTDDQLGPIATAEALAPGASWTTTAAAPIGVDTTNVATVAGEYGFVESQFYGTVSDEDDAFVDVVAPAIDVEKTATPTEILAGETVEYRYVVTNTGDVPLNDVVLTDDKLGSVGEVDVLAVGGTAEFTESAALTVPTTNTVEAVGTDDFGHVVTDTDDAFVDVAAPFSPPDLVIEKTANRQRAAAGDTVRYTVTYRNDGPSPASDMVITDDFDERYVTVVDANGGVVAGGTITWNVAGPLYAEDGPQTITYTVRIDSDLPANVTRIRNVVRIFEPTEEDTSDNSDEWTVDVGEPFLPFTGGEWMLLAMAAAAATVTGASLRRAGRSRTA